MRVQERHEITKRPKLLRSGEPYAALPAKLIERRDELAASIAFSTERRLFGEVYSLLQPDYFNEMGQKSGVFVRPIVASSEIGTQHRNPGDIDLLVIPYEDDELVLDRVIALEVKVIRATHARQGKSPNEIGLSQASALRDMGFPYVGLLHLIVSDVSPEHEWQEIQRVRVLDRHGRAERIEPATIDMMPSRLMDRAIGRLLALRTWPALGLAAAYLTSDVFDQAPKLGLSWYPAAAPALWNDKFCPQLAKEVAAYFDRNASTFLDNPRYDPAAPLK